MSENFWKDRKVFVTGCTGLLGSWLTEALVEKGADVVGLVRDLVPRSNLRDFLRRFLSIAFFLRLRIVEGFS